MSEDLPLASAVEALRSELEHAVTAGTGHPVQFELSQITLTLQAVARKETSGQAGIRWYIVSAGGQRAHQAEVTQTLVLNMTPVLTGPVEADVTVAEPPPPPTAPMSWSDRYISLGDFNAMLDDGIVVKLPPGHVLPQPGPRKFYMQSPFSPPVLTLDASEHGPLIEGITNLAGEQWSGPGPTEVPGPGR